MNKYELYKEMRRELAEGYKREIEKAQALLSSSNMQIVNEGTALSIDDDATMAAQGEARKILREELTSTLNVILERYVRNLRTEASNHGIQLSTSDIATAVTSQPSSRPREETEREAKPVNTAISAPSPMEAEAEDPFDTLIRDIEEEYVAREATAT